LFRSYWDQVLAKVLSFVPNSFAYIVGRLGDIGESSGGRHIDERSRIRDGGKGGFVKR
jgi:hypothetical protein